MPVMPARIGPRNPRRVYLKLWREYVSWKLGIDLTQEKLGERFHPQVPKGTVSRWENAKPHDNVLTKGVIEAYAEALNRPVEDMYRPPPPRGEEDDPSLDSVAAEMGVDRAVVIDILKAVHGRKAG